MIVQTNEKQEMYVEDTCINIYLGAIGDETVSYKYKQTEIPKFMSMDAIIVKATKLAKTYLIDSTDPEAIATDLLILKGIIISEEAIKTQLIEIGYTFSAVTVVTMRQARLALLEAGLLNTIEDAIAVSEDEAMKIEWEYATDVRRDWASLIALTETLGMTAEQLDELFILAGSL